MRTSREFSKRTTRLAGAALALALLAGLTGPAAAQQEVDSRWLPFIGCWESAEAEDGAMLCVRGAEAHSGVEMSTVVDGEVVSTDVFRADGVPVEAEREGCRGSEEAGFSRDGHRVFLTSEHLCEGGLRRSSTGLMALIEPDWFIDVEVVEVAGESAAWVRHYRLATDQRTEAAGFPELATRSHLAANTARVVAARAPGIDDVIEASDRVASEAVRTWVVELEQGFDLDADGLIRMADAGVPDDVIDVVVAVTYPSEFDIGVGGQATEQPDRYADAYRPYRGGGFRGVVPYFGYDPFYSSGFYRPYGGYGIYGYGRYGFRPTVVVVGRREGGTSGGRVIKGRGYTSGRGSTVGGDSRPSSRGSAVRRGGSTTTRSAGTKAGSSSSKGRKAKRRGGGGGGLLF